jgi:pimeloyl-ACP methyl ester carboxylesterase
MPAPSGPAKRGWLRLATTLAGASVIALTAVACGGSAHKRRSTATQASAPSAAQRTTQASTASTPSAPSIRGPSINGCNYAVRHAHVVHLHPRGEQLRAAVAGNGSTGVVLANQSDNSACQWLPFPAYLTARGMRVVAFDYGNGDPSREVQAAARFLQSRGVRHLVLIGASIGGAIVIDAGMHLHPQPAAVVSLSAVPEATTYQFPADARRLRSPIFQIGATEDQLTNFGKTTRAIFHESPSTAKRLLLIPGAEHGVDFVDAAAGDRVRAAIVAFIRAQTAG